MTVYGVDNRMDMEKLRMIDKECYSARADKQIERYRKADFTITGPENLQVQYKLKRIDFDFGCNLFMLKQQDQVVANKVYEEAWTKVFNTAVVPLYWEGTEPEQGRLRYEIDTPNDIYRRPPADMVLEFCRQHHIKPKGHPLFWHEFIPGWVPRDWNQLLVLIEKRFQEISERYAGEIPAFDLVNEPSRIWDMTYEHADDGYVMVTPPDGYLEQIFALGERYFPRNELIINEAVSAAFTDFRGSYGGYYQLLERLIREGMRIDKIGLQCHAENNPVFQNIFNAQRLYGVLDGYARLGKELVISEISLPSDSGEEFQARALKQLYTVAFSVPSVSGIFWWNLDDNGVACTRNRSGAIGENLPTSGIMRNGEPKLAYRVLDDLINHQWNTKGSGMIQNGRLSFRGFYGTYEVEVTDGKQTKIFTADFTKASSKIYDIQWKEE